MKKIVVACDSFKGCLTSAQIGQVVAKAVGETDPDIQVVSLPVADGGEGTVEAIASALGDQCQRVTCEVDAPLLSLNQVTATYIIDHQGRAYMELAQASGLPPERRDIMEASTLGTGQMILDAVQRGCREVVLGLGGSATCDGGMGLLAALGIEFYDILNHHLMPCAKNLKRIDQIYCHGLNDDVAHTQFTLIIDVDNPLCGPRGAARIFAPQKGASPQQVEELEHGMTRYARLIGNTAMLPGAGAAGGVVAGMAAFLPKCQLKPGAQFVLDLAHFDEHLADADLVITGEGRIDGQTSMGKAPAVVTERARQRGVPVVAICGSVAPEADASALGFKRILPVTPPDMPLEQALQPQVAAACITKAVKRLIV